MSVSTVRVSQVYTHLCRGIVELLKYQLILLRFAGRGTEREGSVHKHPGRIEGDCKGTGRWGSI